MSVRIKILISPDGRKRFSFDGKADRLLNKMGIVTRKRASYILPCNKLLRLAFKVIRWVCGDDRRFQLLVRWTRNWKCSWYVDLSPSGGSKRIGPFTYRQQAISYEYDWLSAHIDSIYERLENGSFRINQ